MNPAIAFTLILLSLMVGAGIVSASWGYTLGHQALMGVRQPEARPTSGGTAVDRSPRDAERAELLSEDAILQNVEARIQGSPR